MSTITVTVQFDIYTPDAATPSVVQELTTNFSDRLMEDFDTFGVVDTRVADDDRNAVAIVMDARDWEHVVHALIAAGNDDAARVIETAIEGLL